MPDDSRLPPHVDGKLDVREAIASDLDALVQLEASAFRFDRLSRRSLRHMLQSPTARLLVACGRERIVGYALVTLRQGSRSARLYSLAVHPGDAGQGIGSTLLRAAEQAVVAAGGAHLRLEVRTDNEAAIRLYSRRGYQPSGRIENYYADGAAALRLARNLLDLADRKARPAALGRAA